MSTGENPFSDRAYVGLRPLPVEPERPVAETGEVTYAEWKREHDAQVARVATKYADAKKRHVGTLPGEVWGEEAAKLCADFISFAGEVSIGSQDLLGARELMHVNPQRKDRIKIGRWRDWPERIYATRFSREEAFFATSGYRIAYSTKRSDEVIDRFGGKLPSHSPDVYLCADGLLRRGWEPLLLDKNGDVVPPHFGKWGGGMTPGSSHEVTYSGEGGLMTVSHSYTEPSYQIGGFVPFPPEENLLQLTYSLQRRAREIHALLESK